MIDPGSEKTSEREASPWASTGTAAAATRPIRESPNAKTHYPLQDLPFAAHSHGSKFMRAGLTKNYLTRTYVFIRVLKHITI
jgi:hypothetical protein